MHFCIGNGIKPQEVDEAASQPFLRALVEESFVIAPVKTHQDTCRLWNKATESAPGRPQTALEVPRYKQTLTILLDKFPDAFQVEVNAMFD